MNKLLTFAFLLFVSCSPKLSPDASWSYEHLVLVEMKGVPVQQSGGRRDAYVEFFPVDKRFNGLGGCNPINGSYDLGKKSEIRFTEIISEKMNCPDISFENTFIETLRQ